MALAYTLADLGPDPRGLLARNLERIRGAVASAAERAGRGRDAVEILFVTKYVGPEVLRILYGLGLRDFGESRVQDAEVKARALSDLDGVRFHLVGHLQRNKVRKALPLFRSIHSLDSLPLAEEIDSRLARCGLACPELYVEVNISGEPQKTGLPPEELPRLLEALAAMSRLRPALRGLMGMPPYSPDPEASRPYFRRLRGLRDRMVEEGLLPPGARLSMGMSGDFEVAIEEGADVVRIGSLLFEREGRG